MGSYRIICTNQVPVMHPKTDAHIVALGTGATPESYTNKWTLDQVLNAMHLGDIFYTQGIYSGAIAAVTPYTCSYSRRIYIRSTPDRVYDNNLDSLPTCS